MYAFEPGSTGAFEISTFHQLSVGNNAPGGDPGNAPPSRACPAAPDAISIALANAIAAAMREAPPILVRLCGTSAESLQGVGPGDVGGAVPVEVQSLGERDAPLPALG